MPPQRKRRRTNVHRAAPFTLGTLLAASCVSGAGAADTLELSPVEVVGSGTDAPPVLTNAPTSTPLNATQPTSVIGESYLRDAVPPTSSYDEIARIAPAVLSISPNGPGLAPAADVRIRGFGDGQYNVTFDGIPFADSDDFTHHSNVYFTPHELGALSVDRGPGTASTIGDATFGGTLALISRDPLRTPAAETYASGGSFNTALFGAQIDSGAVKTLDGGAFMINAERVTTDGYLSNTALSRSNLFAKLVLPLGDDTMLTMVTTTLWQRDGQPPGATLSQIAAFGPNFSLSNNPHSQNYAGFNQETYQTDFEYAGITSRLTDTIDIDNKLYTYALYRHFNTGLDVNGETPNGTIYGPKNVAGLLSRNDLRAWGDIFRANTALPFGALHAGFWVEHQENARSQWSVDEALGGIPNPTLSPVSGAANSDSIVRAQRDSLNSFQPYLELDWKIAPAFTATAGVKYAIFQRGEKSPVNEGDRLPLTIGVTYSEPLPALALHYEIMPGWTSYLQVARGFLAPQLQFLDVPDPKNNAIAPERTTNFQIGSGLQHGPLALSGDAYYIDFENMVGGRTVGGQPQVFNEGGVNYLGLEAEATMRVGQGFSLYGNGSLASAREKQGGAPVPNAPQATLAGGLIYSDTSWYGSLIDKWVGARYGDVGRQIPLQPFNQLDLNVGYRWSAIKAQLTVQNLLDSRKIDYLAGYTAAVGTPLYFTQSGRGVFATGSVQF